MATIDDCEDGWGEGDVLDTWEHPLIGKIVTHSDSTQVHVVRDVIAEEMVADLLCGFKLSVSGCKKTTKDVTCPTCWDRM